MHCGCSQIGMVIARKAKQGQQFLITPGILFKNCSLKHKMFTKSDFQSEQGMQTAIWGPPLWMTIHTISFNYPVQPTDAQKRAYARWLMATGAILPCRYCRENFKSNLCAAGWRHGVPPAKQPALASRDSFSRFCHKLHHIVNRMLGKPSDRPTFEEVRETYEGFRARCLTANEKRRATTELGCTEAQHRARRKARCVLRVVPREARTPGLAVHRSCCAERGRSKI